MHVIMQIPHRKGEGVLFVASETASETDSSNNLVINEEAMAGAKTYLVHRVKTSLSRVRTYRVKKENGFL